MMQYSEHPLAPHGAVSLMRSLLRGRRDVVLESLASVSPTLAAYADWCQPTHRRFVGPLNDQPARQELVRAIARSANPRAVVETGTHRGATTFFLWSVIGVPTWTVEVAPRYAKFARWRLNDVREITVHNGESRSVLRELAGDSRVPRDNVFFYLDAHWGTDLPLREELLIISHAWDDAIIMIDDFEVPGDPGYGFDDYGHGKQLTHDYLPLAEMGEVEVLFPSCPSSAEGGLRRGCAVIVSRERARALACDGVPLRPATGLSNA